MRGVIDHGDLDEFETALVVGEMVERMRVQLAFTMEGALASTAFEVDGAVYEITLRKKP